MRYLRVYILFTQDTNLGWSGNTSVRLTIRLTMSRRDDELSKLLPHPSDFEGKENLIRHPGPANLASVVWERQAEAEFWFSSFLLPCVQ